MEKQLFIPVMESSYFQQLLSLFKKKKIMQKILLPLWINQINPRFLILSKLF